MSRNRVASALFRLWSWRWRRNAQIMFQSIIIGIITAFAAYILHYAVAHLSRLCQYLGENFSEGERLLYIMLPLPFIGLALSYFFQRVFCGKSFNKSLSGLILLLDHRKSSIPFGETFTHIISSALSVSLGGSAGLEAPSVLTGAAIASNVTRFFKLSTLPRSILLGCGAAAAIAGIFDSPIAGVLFVLEGLLPEISVSTLVPIVLSSATSSVISHLLTGNSLFFDTNIVQWSSGEIIPAFILGAVCAAVGVCIIRGTGYTSHLLHKFIHRPLMRLLIGGALLCLILALFPHLRGQGYPYIERLLLNQKSFLGEAPYLLSWLSLDFLPYAMVFSAIFIKITASSLTINIGDGGIFAPSLFIGAFTGCAFAHSFNMLGITCISLPNFTALGMCGVFTTVMRAPLTGVFLIAETTGGYQLLVPLMIVSAISWYISRIFEPYSIYRKTLISQHLLADNNDIAYLKRMSVENSIIPLPITLKPSDTVSDLEILIRRNLRNKVDVYPVINEAGRLIGMMPYQKLLSIILRNSNSASLFVSDVMDLPDGMMHSSDTVDNALAKMEIWHLHYLPVSMPDTGRFLGVTSKEGIFDKYRKMNAESL